MRCKATLTTQVEVSRAEIAVMLRDIAACHIRSAVDPSKLKISTIGSGKVAVVTDEYDKVLVCDDEAMTFLKAAVYLEKK